MKNFNRFLKEKNKKIECPKCEGAGCDHCDDKGYHVIDESFTKKQISSAIGIASDKRYAGNNMTGAVKVIEKIKNGLSNHPQVMAVLKRQNEELDEGGRDIKQPGPHPDMVKARIKHTHLQSPFKRSKTYVTVDKKDFEKSKKVLGNQTVANGGNVYLEIEESVELDEISASDKKHMAQMYDKKGNLTPLGKRVMDHGKKAADAKVADKARRKEYNAYQKSKRNEEVELDEAPRRKGAPKMTGDSIAIQRARDKAHADAMGRHVKSGRKKSAPSVQWKVQIGKRHYTVTARDTANAHAKARVMAKADQNFGVPGTIERI